MLASFRDKNRLHKSKKYAKIYFSPICLLILVNSLTESKQEFQVEKLQLEVEEKLIQKKELLPLKGQQDLTTLLFCKSITNLNWFKMLKINQNSKGK